MRVAFHGWIGHGNLGEELQYAAHLSAFSGWDFHPYESNPAHEFDAACVSDTFINEHDKRLHQTRDLLARAKAVYCIGAGVSHPGFWSTRPGWRNRMVDWCRLLEQFKFVGVRGPVSKRLLEMAGCKADVRVVGDAACWFKPARPVEPPKRDTIGVSAGFSWNNMWGGDENVIHVKIEQTCERLRAAGFDLRFLSIWPKDDARCEQLAARLGGEVDRLHRPNLDEIFATFSRYTAFLGLKLHTTILAAMHEVPVYALEYRPKCRDFMEHLGWQAHVTRTDRIDPAALSAMLESLAANRAAHTAYLDARTHQMRREWWQAAQEVRQIVEQSVA